MLTPRGLVYPDSSGHTRLWEHLQALADSTDDALDAVEGVWASYAPNLYVQAAPSTSVSKTLGTCRWVRVGNTVHAFGSMVSNVADAGLVTLPREAAYGGVALGTGVVLGVSAPADQVGYAQSWSSDPTKMVVSTAYTGGFRTADAGESIRWNLSYECVP